MSEDSKSDISFLRALVGGAFAGFSVDVVLFPIDTIRTRQQSAQGFWKAGGFKNLFQGISAAATGAAPSASLFFSVYETSKPYVRQINSSDAFINSMSAALGEVGACIIRVPTENVKQRMQVGQSGTFKSTCSAIMKENGFRTFYRGYFTTVLRDSPFAMIQFPIWEALKRYGGKAKGRDLNAFEVSLCGAFAGSSTGALTCPLDVIKTRIILGVDSEGIAYKGFRDVCTRMYAENGFATFFTGVVPRTSMIGIGGFVFLGGYNFLCKTLEDVI